MVGGIGGSLPQVSFNPTSVESAPGDAVQAKIQIAVLKMEQDTMKMEGQQIAQMIEPNKGQYVDAYA